MNKILIATTSFNSEKISPKVMALLNENKIELIFNPCKRRLKEDEVTKLLPDVVGLIAGLEPLTRDVLLKATRLSVISRCGIGMDNVDLDAAKELNIPVYNTPEPPVAAVAELTLGLILCLLRKIAITDREMRLQTWQPRMGNLLSEQIVGIIGFGRVGKKVASLVEAFGAKVLVYDPYLTNSFTDSRVCSLENLLKHVNIVTLHIPGSFENFHFINKKTLDLMQQGSFLINTARGGLIDEESLYQALSSHHLAGAALDVFEQEPYQGPLLSLPTALLTSHIGSYALEARERMEEEAMKNLIQGLQFKKILPVTME